MFQLLQRTKNRYHTDLSPLLPQPKELFGKRSFGFNWTIAATKEPKKSGCADASNAQEGQGLKQSCGAVF